MTRISIIEREDMNAEQGRVYDEVKAAGGPVGGPYWAYIRNPALMRQCQDMSACLRGAGLTGRERQIAILTAIRFWSAAYPWAVQVRNSLAEGVDQATVDAINEGRDPGLSDARERSAWAVARELLADKGLSEATYNAAMEAYGEEDMVALVAQIGFFGMVSCTANAFDITPPDSAPARLE